MRRIAYLLMLLSLSLVQAHSMVPHHHHSEDGVVLAHDHGDYDPPHAGIVEDDHNQGAHDEPFLGLEAKHSVHHLHIALPMPMQPVVVSYGTFEAVLKIAARPNHPPVHGPPRQCDLRGPPTSPVA